MTKHLDDNVTLTPTAKVPAVTDGAQGKEPVAPVEDSVAYCRRRYDEVAPKVRRTLQRIAVLHAATMVAP